MNFEGGTIQEGANKNFQGGWGWKCEDTYSLSTVDKYNLSTVDKYNLYNDAHEAIIESQ